MLDRVDSFSRPTLCGVFFVRRVIPRRIETLLSPKSWFRQFHVEGFNPLSASGCPILSLDPFAHIDKSLIVKAFLRMVIPLGIVNIKNWEGRRGERYEGILHKCYLFHPGVTSWRTGFCIRQCLIVEICENQRSIPTYSATVSDQNQNYA